MPAFLVASRACRLEPSTPQTARIGDSGQIQFLLQLCHATAGNAEFFVPFLVRSLVMLLDLLQRGVYSLAEIPFLGRRVAHRE